MILYCYHADHPRKIQGIPNQEFKMESLNLIMSYIYIEIHFLAINLFYFHLQIPPLKQNAFHKRFKNAVVKNSEIFSVSV